MTRIGALFTRRSSRPDFDSLWHSPHSRRSAVPSCPWLRRKESCREAVTVIRCRRRGRAPPVRGEDRVHLSVQVKGARHANLLRPTPADPGQHQGGSSCPATCPFGPTSLSSGT